MNDLERELRTALDREAGNAPAPHGPRAALRRTRRRQIGTVGMTVLAVVAVAAIAFVGYRSIGGERDRVVPASTSTETMNGVTITFPETWNLVDPDEAGLNGGPAGTEHLPRMILALTSTESDEAFACPGLPQTPGPTPTFLMTVQETPLALSGDPARPWPVELEPLEVDTSEAACYPGWAFSQTAWSASGRSFIAAVGVAPEASDADRDALFAAFESMTFAPSDGGPVAAVLGNGELADGTWRLIATREGGGLFLTFETEGASGGASTGSGPFIPNQDSIQLTDSVIATGGNQRRLVYGAVPAEAVRLGLELSDASFAMPAPEILDVPDEIDADLNAFMLMLDPDVSAIISAYDEDDRVIASGDINTGTPSDPSSEGELADGRHFGFVRAVNLDEATIEFDLAYFLTGEEANRAYQEATGETGPVPNDYYVVNENPRLRQLALSPDLRLRLLDWTECCDRFFDGELRHFARAIAERSDFLVHGEDDVIYRGLSSWWITIENGVVVEIEEQYTP